MHYNHITNIKGISACIKLTHLNASDNNLTNLESLPCSNLEYISIYNNKINTMPDIS